MNPALTPQHIVARFAPSPTGRLHLGHGWSALLAHDFSRGSGGQFRLRIEDIDGTRSRAEYVQGILEDLEWLGLSWDGPVVFQSERLPMYGAALGRLISITENYPDLKSNQNFLALQSQLEGTENRISVARRDYIEAVRVYNTELRTIPGSWWNAIFYGNKPMETFTIAEDKMQPPTVKFN